MPKGTLDNIAPQKRERVLREAALLFAEKGYAQTDMAQLAQRAGISKGSIYTYFDSKDELFLYVCRDGLERSRNAVWGGLAEEADIHATLDHVFRRGLAFAREYPEYVTLYLAVGTAGMERFADELSRSVEKPTADALKEKLVAGIEAGTVRADLDVEHAAWLINNTYVMLAAPLASRHFQIRMTEYLGGDGTPSMPEMGRHLERTLRLLGEFLRPADDTGEGRER
jgi:AcrR family transcriptional regulator